MQRERFQVLKCLFKQSLYFYTFLFLEPIETALLPFMLKELSYWEVTVLSKENELRKFNGLLKPFRAFRFVVSGQAAVQQELNCQSKELDQWKRQEILRLRNVDLVVTFKMDNITFSMKYVHSS